MLHPLTSAKKISLALGVVGIGALMGLPALAQSSSGETPEFELSKEGYIILCERTPLNSRCEGSPYYTGSSSPTENPAASPSGTTAPSQDLPSETDETDPSSSPDTLTPDVTPDDSGSGDNTTPPSGTTAPTEDLPSETDETAPQEPSSGGSMNDSSPSGSDGSMGSPDNTTAPTQNLPSETQGK